jgi:hypothetical protein
MSKSEVQRLRSIRQLLLLSLSFLISGGIVLLAYSQDQGITVGYLGIILLSLSLNFLLIFQIQVIWVEIRRRTQCEAMVQKLSEQKDDLERQLKALLAEKEQGKVDTRNREQQLADLSMAIQGESFEAYVDSYFLLVGKEWQLMQGLLFMRGEDDVYRIRSHYAYYSEHADLEFVSGETLLGQVVKEGEPLYIDNVASETILVASGTGSSKPCSLYLIPVKMSDGIVRGIFELAFVKTLEENDRELLLRLTERMAIELEKKKA